MALYVTVVTEWSHMSLPRQVCNVYQIDTDYSRQMHCRCLLCLMSLKKDKYDDMAKYQKYFLGLANMNEVFSH